MTRDEMLRLVTSQATLLGPRLYESMSAAIQGAETRARGLKRSTYPHLRPLLTRAEVREYLRHEGLPEPWVLDGNPSLMGQLSLTAPELGLTLRLLKERRRTYPDGVPPAGRNPGRRQAWQEPLPLEMLAGAQPAALTELLLLWDYAESEKSDDTSFTLRIVHTTEAGEYGRAVRCDLDLRVQAGGTIFEQLVFRGDTDDHDFFAVDIDEASTGEPLDD